MRPVTALPTPKLLGGLSDEQVAAEITTWGGRIAAGEARLLAYVGEFDARKAWAVSGILSCAHWLSWKLGMGVKAASDRVRVARSLRDLPKTFAAFAAGRLSFTQVRAITRIATAADEEVILSIARHASGEQIERLAGGIRRARKLAAKREKEKDGEPALRRPTVHSRYDADGDLLISVRISASDGAVVLAALEAACADLDSPAAEVADRPKSSAEDSPAPARATRGQGFLRLSQAYLQHRGLTHPDRARRDRSQLNVQVDPLSGWARLPNGELLPPDVAAAARLSLPAGTALRPLRPTDLNRHDAGRTLREPSQALRDLLVTVDGQRCRFPGCTRHRRLHAHHLATWSNGGRTDLANLVLLCSRHHTVVHADGFQLTLDPVTRVLTVTTKTGEPIPHRPPLPWQPAGELDPADGITAGTLPPLVLDKLDLHYAVSVLLRQADYQAPEAA
jgi:hypothetical protein